MLVEMRSLGHLCMLLGILLAMSASPALGPEGVELAGCADCAADACPDCDQCAGCANVPLTSPAVFPSERLLEGTLSDAPWSAPSYDPVPWPRQADIFHPPRSC
jgi:hypothetical protein